MKELKWILLRWILAGLVTTSYSLIYAIIGPITLQISQGILNLFTETILRGNLLYVGGKTLEFIPSCAAISAYILLGILILLTRGINIKTRIVMALYGSVLILAANILRIEVLIYVLLQWGKNYFDTLHLFIWQIVSSMYVALVWVYLTWRFKVKGIPLYSDMRYVWKKFRR